MFLKQNLKGLQYKPPSQIVLYYQRYVCVLNDLAFRRGQFLDYTNGISTALNQRCFRPIQLLVFQLNLLLSIFYFLFQLFFKVEKEDYVTRPEFKWHVQTNGVIFTPLPFVSALIEGRGRYIDPKTGKNHKQESLTTQSETNQILNQGNF